MQAIFSLSISGKVASASIARETSQTRSPIIVLPSNSDTIVAW
ncbi:MAG: hypothetical protein BWY06_01344 [Candidatus Latescibacteria bacterium ADurb.Bin168]|nr:MAG: hypothetical protein BWY06_01344 [Candidatus Latescibacteria bacterium ADurb.Bin168]